MRRNGFPGQDILFAELRQQNLRVGVAIPIVENVDESVGRLETVGIRNRRTFIQQQSAFPCLALVVGAVSGRPPTGTFVP